MIDLSRRLQSLYFSSPALIKSVLADLYYNKAKGDRLYFHEQLPKSYTAEEILSIKRMRLIEHLISAGETEYWSEVFKGLSVTKNDCIECPFDVYNKIPVLSKNIVKKKPSAFVNYNYSKKKLNRVSTSGSTGSSLVFFETDEARRLRWGVWWRYRQSLGISPNMRCAYFGGKSIISAGVNIPPFSIGGVFSNQKNFSCYHISQKNVRSYVNELNEFSPEWIHGYPSALSALAGLALEGNYELNFSPSFVTVGSESLLPDQVKKIELFFNCPVYQHYGLAESVANISETKEHNLLVDEDFALTEFIPIDGVENTYRIVGTNWSNLAFPLLKYDTGDVAYSSFDVSDLLSPSRQVDRIDGRIEDYILLPSGRLVGRIADVFRRVSFIIEAQVHQKVDYSLIVKVVASSTPSQKDIQSFKSLLLEKLGESIPMEVNFVERINKTKSGKLRLVTSELR